MCSEIKLFSARFFFYKSTSIGCLKFGERSFVDLLIDVWGLIFSHVTQYIGFFRSENWPRCNMASHMARSLGLKQKLHDSELNET